MKKTLGTLLAMSALAGATGCAYGSAAAIGNDKAVPVRNDGFLFGALRKVFVCKVGDSGLTGCASQENP